MKIIRYNTTESNEIRYGWIMGDMVGPIEGDIFSEYRRLEPKVPLEKVRLQVPVTPEKIICIARNYEAHANEQNVDVPEIPMIFLKPPSSLLPHRGTIMLPPQSAQVEHEAELAVVIGKSGRWIQPDEANDYILGYTIANDVTARDLQRKDGQWTRGKGFDTFCPLGPWIETELDISDILITCRVNGELRQMSSTKEVIFSIPQLLTYISTVMTLKPGDVILTGTPAGVGALEDGDTVEVEVEGIGSLYNFVKQQSGS